MIKAVTELIQFVGYFLAIGAIGFRFGVVRKARGISDEAMVILGPDRAALFGVVGVLLIALALIGGPFVNAIANGKTFAESLPKNLPAFEFKVAMLVLALLGFTVVASHRRLDGLLRRSESSRQCCSRSIPENSPGRSMPFTFLPHRHGSALCWCSLRLEFEV